MRIYQNAYELFSEAFRDLHEMALIVKPKSYQNKVIEGKDEFITKEIQDYTYTLTAIPDPENLFLFEDEVAESWCNAEFMERISKGDNNPGTAWLLRKNVWEKFLNAAGEMDYTYSARFNYRSNLSKVVKELLRNPDTRQAWLPIFNPDDVSRMGGIARIPCSLGYFFMIREGQLNLTYIQRSADIVQHFGNDVYLAWQMMEFVVNLLQAEGMNVKVGYLKHHIFSLHSYKKDWDKLSGGISKLSNNG